MKHIQNQLGFISVFSFLTLLREHIQKVLKMLVMKVVIVGMVRAILDMVVAGVSLMIVLGFFTFTTSVLCCVAFFRSAKRVS